MVISVGFVRTAALGWLVAIGLLLRFLFHFFIFDGFALGSSCSHFHPGTVGAHPRKVRDNLVRQSLKMILPSSSVSIHQAL